MKEELNNMTLMTTHCDFDSADPSSTQDACSTYELSRMPALH